jgi:hypothetical protein
MPEKLRFLAFQGAPLPVQPGDCGFVDNVRRRITATISRIWLELAVRTTTAEPAAIPEGDA